MTTSVPTANRKLLASQLFSTEKSSSLSNFYRFFNKISINIIFFFWVFGKALNQEAEIPGRRKLLLWKFTQLQICFTLVRRGADKGRQEWEN